MPTQAPPRSLTLRPTTRGLARRVRRHRIAGTGAGSMPGMVFVVAGLLFALQLGSLEPLHRRGLQLAREPRQPRRPRPTPCATARSRRRCTTSSCTRGCRSPAATPRRCCGCRRWSPGSRSSRRVLLARQRRRGPHGRPDRGLADGDQPARAALLPAGPRVRVGDARGDDRRRCGDPGHARALVALALGRPRSRARARCSCTTRRSSCSRRSPSGCGAGPSFDAAPARCLPRRRRPCRWRSSRRSR